ncbi:tetratricopeptide repeat protein [uncultured Desulfovibrio sp.]|uniref:Tetratricopeptide repeat protein n=1 Tax=Candidatus Desulfovibrio intestinavium TaxID=2838534 RepID=A0A9D2KRW1_9BACT|nr:tetratricopeptide repeat protein [uncultured Desulfovibrio sp.]HJA78811.1 tetratricopeptide repeat protein [Candidatus Desulfovibrio intestinavium]
MENQLDYDVNKELGECYLLMQDYGKAEEYYRKAVTSNPQLSAPYMGLATVAVQRGELDNALVLYRKAASVEPDSKAYCGIGLVLMEQGKAQEAFDAFAQSLDMAKDGIVALNGMLRTAYAAGCVDKVVPYLEAAIAADVQPEALRITLAGCLIHLDRKDEARALLEKVLADNPQSDSARSLLDTLRA